MQTAYVLSIVPPMEFGKAVPRGYVPASAGPRALRPDPLGAVGVARSRYASASPQNQRYRLFEALSSPVTAGEVSGEYKTTLALHGA